eukprot:Hpha_TRINITY_DN16760_c2_g2::TRINITY_DN16760_c2_g2_i2::g.78455::m.78455
MLFTCSNELGETQTGVVDVELDVVGTHEHVTQDNQGASRGGDVHAHEAEDALAHTSGAGLDHVLLLGDRVHLTAKGDVDARTRGVAVDGVLAVERRDRQHLLRADLLGQGSDVRLGDHHEGGAGVHDRLRGRGHSVSARGHRVHGERPVALLAGDGVDDRDVREVTGVVVRVDATHHKLTGATVAAQVEGEDVGVEGVTLHDRTQGGLHTVNRDVVPTHTADPVEMPDRVAQTKALGVVHLSEGVGGHGDTGHHHGVLGVEAGHRTAAVLDLEDGTVGGVGRALVVVVDVVGRNKALVVRDPKVGRARVVDDLHGLRGGAHLHLTVELSVLVVVDHDRVGGTGLGGDDGGGLGQSTVLLRSKGLALEGDGHERGGRRDARVHGAGADGRAGVVGNRHGTLDAGLRQGGRGGRDGHSRGVLQSRRRDGASGRREGDSLPHHGDLQRAVLTAELARRLKADQPVDLQVCRHRAPREILRQGHVVRQVVALAPVQGAVVGPVLVGRRARTPPDGQGTAGVARNRVDGARDRDRTRGAAEGCGQSGRPHHVLVLLVRKVHSQRIPQ